jgi:hypothetical protein
MTCRLSAPAVGIRLQLAEHNLERLDALTQAWGMLHRGEALDHLLEQLWEDATVTAPSGCSGASTLSAAEDCGQNSVQCGGRGGIGWLRALFTRRR